MSFRGFPRTALLGSAVFLGAAAPTGTSDAVLETVYPSPPATHRTATTTGSVVLARDRGSVGVGRSPSGAAKLEVAGTVSADALLIGGQSPVSTVAIPCGMSASRSGTTLTLTNTLVCTATGMGCGAGAGCPEFHERVRTSCQPAGCQPDSFSCVPNAGCGCDAKPCPAGQVWAGSPVCRCETQCKQGQTWNPVAQRCECDRFTYAGNVFPPGESCKQGWAANNDTCSCSCNYSGWSPANERDHGGNPMPDLHWHILDKFNCDVYGGFEVACVNFCCRRTGRYACQRWDGPNQACPADETQCIDIRNSLGQPVSEACPEPFNSCPGPQSPTFP